MKKTSFIITLLFLTLSIYNCSWTNFEDGGLVPFIGKIHFYTSNQTTQLYIFSQGVDFGSPTVIENFNDSIPIDSLLNAELPNSFSGDYVHDYEFIVKKIGADDPVAEANITVDVENIMVETITGVFEIDTTFLDEFGIPNAVIKIDE